MINILLLVTVIVSIIIIISVIVSKIYSNRRERMQRRLASLSTMKKYKNTQKMQPLLSIDDTSEFETEDDSDSDEVSDENDEEDQLARKEIRNKFNQYQYDAETDQIVPKSDFNIDDSDATTSTSDISVSTINDDDREDFERRRIEKKANVLIPQTDIDSVIIDPQAHADISQYSSDPSDDNSDIEDIDKLANKISQDSITGKPRYTYDYYNNRNHDKNE